MKIFIDIIKYPSLITIIVIFVNIFCFKAPLYNGNWLNWIWFIFNCLVCLLCLLFVYGENFSDDDKETKTLCRLLTGLGSFVILGSIVLKYKLCGLTNTNFIWLASLGFFILNEIDQYPSLLLSIIAIVYIFAEYILLDDIYSIILFIIALISVVTAITSLWLTIIKDNDSYDITPIAVLGLFSVLAGFLIKSNFPTLTDNRLYLFGGFLICSCYSFINNKALLYAVLPVTTVSYYTYCVYSYDTPSVIVISCLIFFSISSFVFMTTLKLKINSLEKEKKKLSDENKKLITIVKELKEHRNNSSNDDNETLFGGLMNGIKVARAAEWVWDKLRVVLDS